ncbi:MAG: thioredoxin family protein [Acidobacteriota bacterium]
MDLNRYFEKGVSIKEFECLLGDNQKLHELHYRKFSPNPEIVQNIKSLEPARILVITEPWCGDSLAILPVIKKISEINGNWEMKVVLRDENPELIDNFLTNGGRAIPVFLFLKKDNSLLFRWGPRPNAAQDIFENHRELINSREVRKEEVMKKIRRFYSGDRGNEIQKEIVGKLAKF